MTISAYKVDSVLRAYSKQNNPKRAISDKMDDSNKYKDIVTLSSGNDEKIMYEKISYGLLDIILNNNQTK